MFGFLYPTRQTIDEPEPTSEHILPEDVQWLPFNHLVSRAAELRENVLEWLDKLGPEEKVSVLCKVQEIAVEMQGRCAIPVEVLPFGEVGDLPYEQATILLSEVKRVISESERAGEEIAALAGAYCQSMAMACLAGSLADGREQRLDCITLKHDFGQQTGKLLETLQPTSA
jgi:hypothetical protein